jgi:hypothetical protein
MMLGNKSDFWASSALLTPRWEDEFPSRNVATFWERPSLPAWRFGSKRILKMSTLQVSAIRSSLSQSQREGLNLKKQSL